MKEWKSITDYELLYEVSNDGNVRRISKPTYLKAGITKKGYLVVGLSKHSKVKTMYIHRLVAEHFIPNPNNYPQVNHKDGDKSNNSVDNLEWVTNTENREHAVKHGLHKVSFGEQRNNSILTDDDVRFIKNNYEQGIGRMNSDYFSKKYNISRQTIINIVYGKKWKHIK